MSASCPFDFDFTRHVPDATVSLIGFLSLRTLVDGPKIDRVNDFIAGLSEREWLAVDFSNKILAGRRGNVGLVPIHVPHDVVEGAQHEGDAQQKL